MPVKREGRDRATAEAGKYCGGESNISTYIPVFRLYLALQRRLRVGGGSKGRGIAAKERSSCGSHCSGLDGGDGVSLNSLLSGQHWWNYIQLFEIWNWEMELRRLDRRQHSNQADELRRPRCGWSAENSRSWLQISFIIGCPVQSFSNFNSKSKVYCCRFSW